MLHEYNKHLTFADITESTEYAHRAGVEFCHFLVCGGPGETPDTLRETYENSLKLQGAIVMALVGMRVYPNTPLFERALYENVFSPDTNFLQPQYYVAPTITETEAFVLLKDFSRRSPNWIVGDPLPVYHDMARRLRAKGVAGPLWGYLATMQRLALGAS